jgi:hypothetical protein
VKLWPSLLIALLGTAVLVAQEKPSATPKPAATADAKAGAKSDAKASSSTDDDERIKATLATLPTNQVFHGVQIPSLGPNGKIQSMFKAETAKRIGDGDMEMQNLQIQIHNADGTTFHVEMAHSVFHFDTKMLTSDTPTTIKREDFVINGDRAEFHIKSRFGRMLGNVKMTIFNTGDAVPAPKRKKAPRPAAGASTATPIPTPKAQ